MNDFGQERLGDKLLAHIEKNSNDERLRELAAGVRSGNTSWAEAMNASFYAAAMQPGLHDFARWYDQLSESERAEQAERCRITVDDLNRDHGPRD